MDRKFAVTVQHGGKDKSYYISAEMTLGALKLLVKEERYFNILYSDDEQKIFLKLKDVFCCNLGSMQHQQSFLIDICEDRLCRPYHLFFPIV